MIIDDLPIMSVPQDGDELPLERGTTTYKIDYTALAMAILNKIGAGSLSESPSMLVNLESTNAANVMAAAPRPGITGVLPVANGGTGRTTEFPLNLSFAATDNTWSAIYGILSTLSNNQSAFYVANTVAASVLANNKLNVVIKGIVSRVNDGVYDFLAYTGYQPSTMWVWRISGLTSASATPTFSDVCRYQGTAI